MSSKKINKYDCLELPGISLYKYNIIKKIKIKILIHIEFDIFKIKFTLISKRKSFFFKNKFLNIIVMITEFNPEVDLFKDFNVKEDPAISTPTST